MNNKWRIVGVCISVIGLLCLAAYFRNFLMVTFAGGTIYGMVAFAQKLEWINILEKQPKPMQRVLGVFPYLSKNLGIPPEACVFLCWYDETQRKYVTVDRKWFAQAPTYWLPISERNE